MEEKLVISATEKHLYRTQKAYLSVFGVILVLSLLGQIAIQYFISQIKYNSHAINISGRQRVLSQRIALLSNKLISKYHKEDALELKNTIHFFNESYYDLKQGNKAKHIPPPFNSKILAVYNLLLPTHNELIDAAKCIIDNCQEKKHALEIVEKKANELFHKMDEIVFDSSLYTEKRGHTLSIIELAFFILICLTMLIELFAVLLPFNKSLIENFYLQNLQNDRKQRLYHLAEIGELSSEITHEINNFISIINGHADLLLKMSKSDESAQKYTNGLQKIKDNIKRIKNIHKGVSNLSRVTALETFSLDDLISDVKDMFAPKFKKNNIEFVVKKDEFIKVKSVQGQVTQVIFNLVKNSIHALEKCDVKKIVLEVSRNQKMINFLISDTGIGIPLENREKVTEAFFTTKISDQGTGLGLSLSKKIAKALGGDLKCIDSKYSTTFHFSIEDQGHIDLTFKESA